ncbi:MAG: ABC transporter permease [Clostridia bacterium]|nr:ABC transporter permease [Clostridia bacterium]
MTKFKFEPMFHLAKRTDMDWKKAWGIRVGAFVLSILVCAIVSTFISDRSFGFFFENFFKAFNTPQKLWNFFHDTAILLIIALAVTPCFKMRFWNIGGEGQILMGALGSAVIINFMGGKHADAGVIILSLMLSIAFGMAWAVIPALFKAKWNTNETLLTLMMNYISVCIVDFFIKSEASSGTGTMSFDKGIVEPIAGNEFILKIILVAIVTGFMIVYLKYSKHGYELAVVGESEKTARYIGINTKKVIIRTLILCGAICGLIGFMLVSATNHSISSVSTVGGKGFTGVLVSWLGHFNPLAMLLCSFLVVFITRGATQVSTYARLGASYPNMMTGIFFFFIIATEFFINYKILSTHHFKKKNVLSDDQDATEEAETPAETDSEATDGVESATLALENTKEVE